MFLGICNADNKKLKMNYYHKSCPSVEKIVKEITWSKVAADPTLAAKLLRLHYHDCFVRVRIFFFLSIIFSMKLEIY